MPVKNLFIIRGVPGAGKSTFAKTLNAEHYETDQYFMVNGEYQFNAKKLHAAHAWCQFQAFDAMLRGVDVVVSNTFTTDRDMKPYIDKAADFGYNVHVVIKENYHKGVDVHRVPEETLQRMENSLMSSIKLR